MRLNELIIKEQCPLRAGLKFDIKASTVNRPMLRARIFRQIFSGKNNDTFEDISQIKIEDLNVLLPNDLFDSKKEKEMYIKSLHLLINKFCLVLSDLTGAKIKKNEGSYLNIGGSEIYISADMIFEKEHDILITKIVNSESKIKKNGRTESTKASKSIELYGLYKLGEILYPDKNITSSIIYLKEKNLKNYIVTRDSLTQEEEVYFEEKIKSIIEKNYFDECETCAKSCEFYPICTYTHNLEKIKEVKEKKRITKEEKSAVINFSEEQQRVIDFNKGYALVNAVAGAGKTTVLSKRVEKLLTVDKCKKNDIIIISFSEKTVDEFKEKLSTKFGIYNFSNIYTFNGLGDKLLKSEYALFGYTKPPQLMDEIIKYSLIKEVIESTEILVELDEISEIWSKPSGMIVKKLNYEMMLPSGMYGVSLVSQFLKIFDEIKSRGLDYTGEQFVEEYMSLFNKSVISEKKLSEDDKSKILDLYRGFLEKIYFRENSMYGKYMYLLKDRGYYDYIDQVNYLVASFSNSRLKNKYRFKHIICDEFQDSNNCAMEVLRNLTLNDEFQSLLVVGDINQSIYGFQGAIPENLIMFEQYFEDKVNNFNISYSYRVPQIVARKANLLMEDSDGVIYNKMNAFKKDEGEFIESLSNEDLLSVVRKDIDDKKTIGIITRNNNDLNDFISILSNNDISYVVKSNLYMMKKPKILNLNGLYKVLLNPEQNKIEFLKFLMVSENDIFVEKFKTEEFEEYINNKYNDFLRMIDTKNYAELLLVYYNMLEPLSEQDYIIESYLNKIKEMKPKTILDVASYCYELEVYAPSSLKVPENNTVADVVLTTGHSSKGREFDTVIIDISTFTDLDEEDRRLFYVAITRAKEKLIFIDFKRKVSASNKNCRKFLQILSDN